MYKKSTRKKKEERLQGSWRFKLLRIGLRKLDRIGRVKGKMEIK